jgi:hypothetical protein
MADTTISISDTHVTWTFPINNQDDETVDLTNATSATLVVRPEQGDESTKVCTINNNVDSGTNGTTAATTLTEAAQNFQTTVTIGDLLVFTSGANNGTSHVVTGIPSDTQVSVTGPLAVDTGQSWYITDGSVTVQPDAGMFEPGDQEVRVKILWNDATVSPTITKFIVKGLT